MSLSVQQKIKCVHFWLERAIVCIILDDYDSAFDKLERASFELDWVGIAMVYGD